MKIRFYDKETGKDAKLLDASDGFFLDKNGKVCEFEGRAYEDAGVALPREDVGIELTMDEEEICNLLFPA
jgi:hypothetical protein